ncbi:MAG: hypothetical protein ACI4JQ_01100 [Ruminococcus sp.]
MTRRYLFAFALTIAALRALGVSPSADGEPAYRWTVYPTPT